MDLPTLDPIPGQGLPARVQSLVSGGRDLWSEPLTAAPADPTASAWECLREVLDPEIPISLVDLGLIYDLKVDRGVATVTLTYTATACPCMAFITEDLTDRLIQEPWLDRVEILEVWDPPWTSQRISPEGRVKLRAMGVGM
jgi:metal-sulfur cluster biosynthetic enzyme